MIIIQPSKLLNSFNIVHGIGGSQVNFKQSAGEAVYQASLQQLLDALSVKPVQIHHGNQVHGANVEVVTSQVEERSLFAGYPISPETDGFITNQPDVGLLVRMADCTPIIIYDPVHQVIGAVHSGWRGTVQKISQVAIQTMMERFGSQVEDLVVYVGPSIDPANYEVGLEVYEAFASIGNRDRYFKPQGEKYRLDMVQANIEVLKAMGVKEKNIDYSSESTYTSERLHSARKEGANYQLNALFVMMPESFLAKHGRNGY